MFLKIGLYIDMSLFTNYMYFSASFCTSFFFEKKIICLYIFGILDWKLEIVYAFKYWVKTIKHEKPNNNPATNPSQTWAYGFFGVASNDYLSFFLFFFPNKTTCWWETFMKRASKTQVRLNLVGLWALTSPPNPKPHISKCCMTQFESNLLIFKQID